MGSWRPRRGSSPGSPTGTAPVLLLLVLRAAAFAALARPVIDTVLRYGKLTQLSADLTASHASLIIFLVGLPGFSTYLLRVRAFQAVQDTRSVFWLYAIENGLNIVAALALVRAFGVEGVSAAGVRDRLHGGNPGRAAHARPAR